MPYVTANIMDFVISNEKLLTSGLIYILHIILDTKEQEQEKRTANRFSLAMYFNS